MRLTFAVVMMVVAPVVMAQAPALDIDPAKEWQRAQPMKLEELKLERRLAAEEAARSLFSTEMNPPAQLNLAAEPVVDHSLEPDWSLQVEPVQSTDIEFEYQRPRLDNLNPHNTW